MPAFQRKACLAVIEFRQGDLPVRERKLFSVVFGVAAGAVIPLLFHQRGMHAAALGQSLPDLGMAVQALEPARTARHGMALHAVCRPAQRFVRPGKRPWRKLRAGAGCAGQKQQDRAPSRRNR